eukprot:TRINITY_DN2646_c0_g2_i2.p1 TRINITY_DN2646_c0_g2~~TRINITY_DN2646_c0_g2_i2.p1  ORF type:complete len:1290 (-),score=97.72 TRINITY_DN2646_c0_g2_i2:320-4189(-)
MARRLYRMSLGELREEALNLELVDSEEALQGLKKAELASLVRDYLLACGLDPAKHDFNAPEDSSCESTSNPPQSIPLGVSQPQPFQLSGPRRGHRWATWASEFETYASLVGELSPERKAALLLHCAGSEVQQWRKSMKVEPKEEEDVYTALRCAMDEVFSPVESIIFERHQLHEMKQALGEPIDDFLTRLRSQARFCKFICGHCKSSYEEDTLAETVVTNTCSTKLRRIAFEKKVISLDEIIQMGRALESADNQSREMNLEKSAMTSEYKGPKGSRKWQKNTWGNKSHTKGEGQQKDIIQCKFCASKHRPSRSSCPAVGKTCRKCGQADHFASCCSNRVVNCIVGSVSRTPPLKPSKRVFVEARISRRTVKFLLDLGANVNLIPRRLVPEKAYPHLEESITCFGGASVPILGQVSLPLAIGGASKGTLEFLVTEVDQPILGSEACLKLGLVSIHKPSFLCNEVRTHGEDLETLNSEFHHIFNDAGHQVVNHAKAVVHIDKNASPRYLRARSVPLALKDKVITELKAMVARGTLEEVQTSEWASPIVVVPKPDGSVRICADYTQTISPVINKLLYPLPHPEELFSGLAGASYFSKLDFSHCYEQYEVEERSKELLTINTPIGLLRYNVLPYGLASAPAIVQAAQEKLLEGITDVKVYIDDLLIFSKSLPDHITTLRRVYERLANAGARLNKKKCLIAQKELTYLGFKVSEAGRSLDPELIRPIMEFPTPSSSSEVKSFLGLVQFYGHFLKDLSKTASPLHELTRPIPFNWSEEASKSFVEIKETVSNAPLLVHYDPSIPLFLATDASPIGIGAVLSHQIDGMDRPIAFASRKLSKAERNYSQIDREATAIVFGLNRFERYLLGRRFCIKTDHKPLEFILHPNKGLPAVVTARLSRFALRLSSFDFEIIHVKGVNNSNADALSRGPIDNPPAMEDPVEVMMCAAISSSPSNGEELREALMADEPLRLARDAAKTGDWSLVSDKAFLGKRFSFSVNNDLLFWGVRLVVPSQLRRKFLDELHLTHRGIVKMKSLARSKVWWPRIDQDIETLVGACGTCQSEAPSPPASFVPFRPSSAWDRVHIDFLQFKRKDYLILVDAGSKWIEAAPMASTNTVQTIQKLLYWFSRFGFPKWVHADNGPQFANPGFKSKLAEWGVELSFSPPYHPQSNGQAERGVRIVKNLLRKNPGTSVDELLFCYRATPLACGMTPAELLLSRPIRTRLDGFLNSSPRPSKGTLEKKMPVWVRSYDARKLKWVPGELIEEIGKCLWTVCIDGKGCTRHVNQLRPRRVDGG